MKHAVILSRTRPDDSAGYIEAVLSDGRTLYLAEKEYDADEFRAFEKAKEEWLISCSGSQTFLADSDSGEDAKGYYGNYFELLPEKAVFQNGKMTGIYLCSDGINYSGRGRYNYDIDAWGIPGYDPFSFIPTGRKTIVLLFDDDRNCRSGQFMVLRRIPGKEYKEYLEF